MVNPNLFEKLEATGLKRVKEDLAKGHCGSEGTGHHKAILRWVKLKEDALASARDEESLSISRKALAFSEEANIIALKAEAEARRANKIAISAIIFPTIIAIIAIIIALATKN